MNNIVDGGFSRIGSEPREREVSRIEGMVLSRNLYEWAQEL